MKTIWPINQFLILSTSILIILAFMKISSGILSPFLIAVSFSIILSPLFKYLNNKKIPKVISLIFIIILVTIPIIIVGGYVGNEVKDLAINLPEIKDKLTQSIENLIVTINNLGIHIDKTEIKEIISRNNFSGIIKDLASQTGNQFSNIFLILFTVGFILIETDALYNKMKKILEKSKIKIDDGMKIIEKINMYFKIKVKTSLLTGILVLIVLWSLDIHYFYIWATLAFFLNFIPVVGSIFAAIPAIIITGIDYGLVTTLWVTLSYIIINTIIGNILEPKIMGEGLGLSALVIFLSMTLWGWILGPTGMILSVPLTMGAQFFFEQYKETKWISILLSDYGYKEEVLKIENKKEETPSK